VTTSAPTDAAVRGPVASVPALEPATTTASTAVDVLWALRTVTKRLERTMPPHPAIQEFWAKKRPAPRHIAALMQIVADEGMSVTTLASRLGVSLATASQVVTDLETHGLVERIEDPTDRRRTLVKVAETHRDVADSLLDTRLRPLQRALDRMRPGEQRALLRGLQLIADVLQETEGSTT
jgi:DNA-binding MarR family transcriptional regulator